MVSYAYQILDSILETSSARQLERLIELRERETQILPAISDDTQQRPTVYRGRASTDRDALVSSFYRRVGTTR